MGRCWHGRAQQQGRRNGQQARRQGHAGQHPQKAGSSIEAGRVGGEDHDRLTSHRREAEGVIDR